MDKTALLKSIRERSGHSGVLTADRYFRSIESCFDGGFCPTTVFKDASQEQWTKALKESESRLTYTSNRLKFKSESLKTPDDGSEFQAMIAGHARAAKALGIVDGILTTTKRDRDRDILETKGAIVDPKMPLLWQHSPFAPMGTLLKVLKHTDQILICRFAIADTAIGEDAMKLIEIGALRISHGFDPREWDMLDDEEGFHFKSFEVFEGSGVSIPSNTDAEFTAFSRNRLKSAPVRQFIKAKYDARPKQGISMEFKPSCSCGTKAHKELDADPLRWNRSLSKAFEVQHQDLPAASFILGWAAKFLECEIKNIYQANTFVPSARMGSFLTALDQELSKHTIVDTRNIDGDGEERPPLFEQIQLNSKASETFLIDGTRFLRGSRTKFMLDVTPSWGGVELTIFCPAAGKDFANQLFTDCWQWAKTHNFLKGESFSLSGEFLPRGTQDWSDIFLEERNKVPLERTIKQINEKGAACPNRGMILMGPPGTGKTLSGRCLKDQAESTFIWISARDLHRAGAFGGFQYAFELAKEVSPCILFVEDIDNFMDDWTVDLLKSQMDGIGRSSGIVTVLTTNFPERLPEALIDRPGRFHDVLKFDLPDAKIRAEMLRKWLPSLATADVTKAVERTEGYSGAHIYELAAFAKTIQDQDEIELPDAVTKALDKIVEQRELINGSQLSGSRYRPRREAVEAVTKSLHRRTRKGSSNDMLCPECGHRGSMADFCRTDGLGDAQDNIPEVRSADTQIKSEVDSRQGLPVIAQAQSEDAAWHETFEMLGLN